MATGPTATRLLRGAAAGAAAGAVGTAALNAVTYGDMLVRGRPASTVPSRAAGILADRLGIAPLRTERDDQAAENRRGATGALLGYVTGIGVGVGYAAVRSRFGAASPLRAGVLLGLAAMAAGDGPIVATGASDPRTWSAADWLADLVPHLAYGLAAAAAFEAAA